MSSGSANIKTTPTLSIQKVGVDLKAALVRQREHEFKYTFDFGFRKLGDDLVDFRQEPNYYATPQDVELIVTYQAGEGCRLAYAEIKVDQSSDEREASIIDGGIGEDHISILIKARNTFWFNYESRIYAKKVTLS